jgi:predicted methyltransferase
MHFKVFTPGKNLASAFITSKLRKEHLDNIITHDMPRLSMSTTLGHTGSHTTQLNLIICE